MTFANAYSVGAAFHRANGQRVGKGRFVALARFTTREDASRCAAVWIDLTKGPRRPDLKYLGPVEVEA